MPRCADIRCKRWRLFGALQFNGNWYCSRGCVERTALAGLGGPEDGVRPTGVRRSLPPLKLGVLLRHAGVITGPQLEAALAATARTGLRIGEQLEQMGFVSPDAVLRALATQAGVSYLSNFNVARVTRAPGSLPPAMVRALGLVPFEADVIGQRLHVITAAPVPRSAIRAMTRLTGWNVEVYLVNDAVFEAAVDAYQPAKGSALDIPAEPSAGRQYFRPRFARLGPLSGWMQRVRDWHRWPHSGPMAQALVRDAYMVRTLDAAAARVAERASLDRAVTMRHVAYDDYVWVRVEGSQRVSDLLVGKDPGGPRALTTCESQRGFDSGFPAARTPLDSARGVLSASRRTERPVVVDEGDSTKCQAASIAH